MHEPLERLRAAARRFLDMHLLATPDASWERDVLAHLSLVQAQIARDQGWRTLADLDVASLLRVIDGNWDAFRRKGLVSYEARHWLKEAASVRNRWAHASSHEVDISQRYRDLDTLSRLAGALGSTSDRDAIAAARDALITPGAVRANDTGRRPRPEPAATRALSHQPGPVQAAVRASIQPGDTLATPTGRGTFRIARYSVESIVLLLGEKEAWTPLPWQAFEEVPDLLRGRGWLLIGGTYSVEATEDTLDAHMKRFLNRATAGWVAVVLERAGVVSIDRSRPSKVRLNDGW